MAGLKQRFKIQWVSTQKVPADGRIRTVVAQSHIGAKRAFIAEFAPPKGSRLMVWAQGNSGDKREMRV